MIKPILMVNFEQKIKIQQTFSFVWDVLLLGQPLPGLVVEDKDNVPTDDNPSDNCPTSLLRFNYIQSELPFPFCKTEC